MASHRYNRLEVRIVRIFNTYGPRMRLRGGRVVPAFIQQALRGEPLTVFGKGNQTRSFCYVDDLVEGIYRLLLSDVALPVNIGNPHEMTILQFAETIRRIVDRLDSPGGAGSTRRSSPIVFKPLPEDDPQTRQPAITLARTLLGWEPKVSLDDGIERTIGFFRQALAAAPARGGSRLQAADASAHRF